MKAFSGTNGWRSGQVKPSKYCIFFTWIAQGGDFKRVKLTVLRQKVFESEQKSTKKDAKRHRNDPVFSGGCADCSTSVLAIRLQEPEGRC